MSLEHGGEFKVRKVEVMRQVICDSIGAAGEPPLGAVETVVVFQCVMAPSQWARLGFLGSSSWTFVLWSQPSQHVYCLFGYNTALGVKQRVLSESNAGV
jgi:hypothetical protein